MKLAIQERVLISGLLPENGSYEEVKAKVEFIKTLGFDEEESRLYDIQSEILPDGRQQIRFNMEAANGYVKDIKIPSIISRILKQKLEKMDKDGQMNDNLLPLYEKFVLGA